MSLVFAAALTGAILVAVQKSHAGSDAAAIQAIEQCAGVTEVLGSPIRVSPTSFGCGEYEGGSGHGAANWTIQVRGPRGRGSLSYRASHDGGPWTVHHATVSTAQGSIQAVPCAIGTADPTPKPAKPRREHGKER